ncbi:C-type lectin domain family 4 member F-like [Drosophila takahashii]|uniref:C-type lectin domain family 4 member F-like n=1 Tax=Drosophila takahashii TaxID=29030 RepID=UPI001CF87E37|nr:uncharacterized protein LOC123003507 [Drosophila takahashii]
MLKLAYFPVLIFIILEFQGSLANSKNSVCLLKDPPNQCGQFCLTKLHPMIDSIPETNSKLERILGEQQALRTELLEAHRSSLSNNGSERPNMGVRHQLQLLFTKMENLEAQLQTFVKDNRRPHREPQQRALKKEDFEAMLSVTEGHLLVVNSELKSQLKELLSQKDKHTSLHESLKETFLKRAVEKRLSKTEGQLQLFENKLEAKIQQLHKKTETELLALQAKIESQHYALEEILFRIHAKNIPPQFQLIGTRYFYIEFSIKRSWYEAAATCRRMGGYLAAFETQEELQAIAGKFGNRGHWFWTGINDLRESRKFMSVASGKPAKVLSWKVGNPSLRNACVVLNDDYMIDTFFNANFALCSCCRNSNCNNRSSNIINCSSGNTAATCNISSHSSNMKNLSSDSNMQQQLEQQQQHET